MSAIEPRSSLEQLQELSSALRRVHQRLLQLTQLGFEKVYGRVEGQGALLQLAIHDPLFQWLKPLAELMTDLDERSSDPESGLTFGDAAASVGRLLEEESDFRVSYLDYLQADPEAIFAHAEVRRLVPAKPRTGPEADAPSRA